MVRDQILIPGAILFAGKWWECRILGLRRRLIVMTPLLAVILSTTINVDRWVLRLMSMIWQKIGDPSYMR